MVVMGGDRRVMVGLLPLLIELCSAKLYSYITNKKI
jgi:hypothetical protein